MSLQVNLLRAVIAACCLMAFHTSVKSAPITNLIFSDVTDKVTATLNGIPLKCFTEGCFHYMALRHANGNITRDAFYFQLEPVGEPAAPDDHRKLDASVSDILALTFQKQDTVLAIEYESDPLILIPSTLKPYGKVTENGNSQYIPLPQLEGVTTMQIDPMTGEIGGPKATYTSVQLADGTYLVIQAASDVPEPSTLLLVGVGIFMLLHRSWQPKPARYCVVTTQ
ncbi:MAG: PEP-CTERM sorting domain-containing protein [Nitrosospira sp.]|jgi:hypothetical protein|nr:PEP-CTERM sorting domain-containing protein [Nitrosospira sp.]